MHVLSRTGSGDYTRINPFRTHLSVPALPRDLQSDASTLVFVRVGIDLSSAFAITLTTALT